MKVNSMSEVSINLSRDWSASLIANSSEIKELMKPIKIEDIKNRIFKAEFDLLAKMTMNSYNSEALILDNSYFKSNRYSDVLPFAHNIVKPFPHKDLNFTNYINGNWIFNPFLKKETPDFILTQGPLPNTTELFWQTVYNYNIPIIVCIVEKDKIPSKCFNYWHQETNPKIENLKIKKIESNFDSFVEKSKLKVNINELNLEVQHFYFFAWIDNTALNIEQVADLCKVFDQIILSFKKNPNNPIIAHCSAGIGRSGSFIALFYLYNELIKAKQQNKEFTFSVFSLVRHLREQRFGAVQTFSQYKFLYEFLEKLSTG